MTSGAGPATISLERFKLSGVKRTNRPLGQGAYGYVEEYTYRELRCAGKKLLPILTECTTRQENRAILEKAAEECILLSNFKHPNIVQFLGVHFEDGDPVPILIMEYVPYTLSRFLASSNKAIPPEITYGILVDVARALCYLHGGDPIVIHRDLSANNVLLTSDLRAKVSDLGTARILNVSVSEKDKRCQMMSKCPGTPVYMPPEARSENPDYDENLDCYSYGVLILHILSGEWPVPVDKVHNESDQVVVVLKDIERRQKYIEMIDENHPLMDLMKNCLDERKSKRPSARDILTRVEEVRKRCRLQLPDRMALLIQQRKDAEQKADLERELGDLKKEKKRLELLHSEEQEKIEMEIGTLMNQNEMLRSLVAVRNTETEALEKRVQSKDEMLRQKEEEITRLKQEADREIKEMKKSFEDKLEAYQKQKDDETEAKKKELRDYKESVLKQERIVEAAIKRNEERAQKVHEALHRSQAEKRTVMEYLRSGTQMHPLHHRARSIKWREGPCLPVGMTAPQCVLIKSNLYVGGGQTVTEDRDYRSMIFEYNTSEGVREMWKSPFQQCPTMYFGLGELDGRLVIVGGKSVSPDNKTTLTGKVHVLNDKGEWDSDVIPAMRVPRMRSCVVGFKSCIAACGGLEIDKDCSSAVEIYRSGSEEWCTVSPLPVPRAALRVSIIHETAYFMGGFFPSLTSPGMPNCIGIDLEDLFQADNTIRRNWNDEYCDSPCKSSTPASLCGSLVTLGGQEGQNSQTRSIYAYSSAMRVWHLIDELPVQLTSATAITLPNGELVVLGGRRGEGRNTDVYIGSLE